MANDEHLALLKQGVEVWNKWKRNPKTYPDLSGADLRGIDLGGAILSQTNLRGANLSGVRLVESIMWRTNLAEADLSGTHLSEAVITGASLKAANLSKATLIGTTFTKSNLSQTKWKETFMGYAVFGDVDLTQAEGLESVIHTGPSTLGIDTIYKSQGEIPEVFLRGAGVPENFIEYMRSLTGQAFVYYSCFISHSSKDQAFAERLYADLQSKGVRCWFAPHDLKIGARIRPTIDESIRLHDKLLLVLSRSSVASQWVEQEVERALARERKEQREILFPVRLDQKVMEIEEGWPAYIRNTRNIGDFARWKTHNHYQQAFARLLRDLQAEGSAPRRGDQ